MKTSELQGAALDWAVANFEAGRGHGPICFTPQQKRARP
jgi:hypothetical protein